MVPDTPGTRGGLRPGDTDCPTPSISGSPLFKARDLAIEAYESADPNPRANFDDPHRDHDLDPEAVGKAMREAQQDKTRATLAEQATA